MHIKRFEAPTMAEALAQVKAELGPDALILSSRTVRRGRQAFGLMSRTVVEVQAARERAEGPPLPRAKADSDAMVVDGPGGAMPTRGDAAIFGGSRGERADLRRREEFEEEVRSELRGLRLALNGVLGSRMREEADPVVESLVRAGLDWVHATSLATECRETSSRPDRDALRALLEKRIESRLSPPREGEGANVRILVGAAGVGKTTTLAKLAARNEEGEREVALVSLDHFRIGATDQLRRYAELLDSPFEEAARFSDLPRVVERYRGHAVLVDTAGRGKEAREGFEAVSALRDALGPDVSVELVLDATSRREVHRAQLARFAPMAPDRIIFAKTDECDSLVDAANLVLDSDCPSLCWIGTGQRVPEDLRPVEADQLARAAFGEAA